MVSRIIGWIILVPLCLGLIFFALANRHFVIINLNPFLSIEASVAPGYGVPLFMVLYIVLLVGVLLGGVATWLAQRQHRRSEKYWRREARMLADELEKLRRNQRPSSERSLSEVDAFLNMH